MRELDEPPERTSAEGSALQYTLWFQLAFIFADETTTHSYVLTSLVEPVPPKPKPRLCVRSLANAGLTTVRESVCGQPFL